MISGNVVLIDSTNTDGGRHYGFNVDLSSVTGDRGSHYCCNITC